MLKANQNKLYYLCSLQVMFQRTTLIPSVAMTQVSHSQKNIKLVIIFNQARPNIFAVSRH